MSGLNFLMFTIMFVPFLIIFWNKNRLKGKMVCYFLRKDKSLVPALCKLKDAFVLWGERAYDIYPDYVRVTRFPMGWPSFMQELVPTCLYDEENAIPLDWLSLEPAKEGSMKLRAALDENWMKKLVHETATEAGGGGINWRKILPIAILVIGGLGLIAILIIRSRSGG